MSRLVNLKGQRFGRWLVIKFSGLDGRQQATWLCCCECGTRKVLHASDLKRGNTRSCGCLRKEIISLLQRGNTIRRTHGASRLQSPLHPTFSTWQAMKARCLNPNASNFAFYGGRGIKICKRWVFSFNNFWIDMGRKPKGMTLDRFPNRDGDYKPSNCRWATARTQSNNRRKRKCALPS